MCDDYMQNYLNYQGNGYFNPYEQMMPNYTYCGNNPYMYGMGYNNYNPNVNIMTMQELEEMYPEIYKIIYPMVKKACMNNKKALCKEVIDEMVEEIYENLEKNESINLNIIINNETKKNERSNEINLENRGSRRNNLLKDIIKILILRELINNRPPRPRRQEMMPPMQRMMQDRTIFPY